ncbi:MAG: hypothetical protein ACOCZR_01800 [Halanaerobiales bacterium]
MHLKLFNLCLIICLIFIFSLSFSSDSEAVGVRPLVVDLEMERGETGVFELNLTPTDTQQMVALNLYYPRQQLTGSLSYEECDLKKHAVLNWLELPEEVIIPPDEKKTVEVEVTVPYDARGTHTAIIMVEPVVEEAEAGITFRVRYAVRVNIHIDAPGLRRTAEVKEFKLTADDEDRPLLQAHAKNNSSLSYNAAGEVTVRDENRQLIERVSIRSLHAAQGGRDETTIYPDSKVIFEGLINEPLTPGTYDLQLFLYYADGRQIIERKRVEVGDEFIDPDRLEYIEIDPGVINKELRRGGAHTGAIDIRNRMGDPINIKIGAQKSEPDYKRSLLDNFQIDLRGDQQFKLEGRRSQRPVLIVRAPREGIEDGGYYGTLQIGVFDSETEESLETRNIDMAFIVGENYKYNGAVQDITTRVIEDEVLFSATVLNTGDVHFIPQAKVYLIQGEEIKHTIFLEMADKNDSILPEMTGVLSTYSSGVEPGTYTAEVTLRHEGEDIAEDTFKLDVQESGFRKK